MEKEIQNKEKQPEATKNEPNTSKKEAITEKMLTSDTTKKETAADKQQTDTNKKQIEQTKSQPETELKKKDSRLVQSLTLLKEISGENKKKLLDELFNIADKIINDQIKEGDLDSNKKYKIAVAIVTKKLIEAVFEIRERFKKLDEQKSA